MEYERIIPSIEERVKAEGVLTLSLWGLPGPAPWVLALVPAPAPWELALGLCGLPEDAPAPSNAPVPSTFYIKFLNMIRKLKTPLTLLIYDIPDDKKIQEILLQYLPKIVTTLEIRDITNNAMLFLEQYDDVSKITKLVFDLDYKLGYSSNPNRRMLPRLAIFVNALAPHVTELIIKNESTESYVPFTKLTSLTLRNRSMQSSNRENYDRYGTKLTSLVFANFNDEIVGITSLNPMLKSITISPDTTDVDLVRVTPVVMKAIALLRNLRRLKIQTFDEITRPLVIDYLTNMKPSSLVDVDVGAFLQGAPETWSRLISALPTSGHFRLNIPQNIDLLPLYSNINLNLTVESHHAYVIDAMRRDTGAHAVVMLLHGSEIRKRNATDTMLESFLKMVLNRPTLPLKKTPLQMLPDDLIRYSYSFFRTINDDDHLNNPVSEVHSMRRIGPDHVRFPFQKRYTRVVREEFTDDDSEFEDDD